MAVGLILTLALASAVSSTVSCESARTLYEGLALDEASSQVAAVFAEGRRPLECLEVRGLTLLVLGRLEAARVDFTELFERDPTYVIRDPALSPGRRATIEQIREAVRPLTSRVTARWLIHESLRLDVLLAGGLRDGESVRFRARTGPYLAETSGEARLVGRAATATVAVGAGHDVKTLAVDGQVVGRSGRILHQFSTELVLQSRPSLRTEQVVVERNGGSSAWWVVALISAAAVAGGVAVAFAVQPSLPDGSGTIGRVPIDP